MSMTAAATCHCSEQCWELSRQNLYREYDIEMLHCVATANPRIQLAEQTMFAEGVSLPACTGEGDGRHQDHQCTPQHPVLFDWRSA